MKKSNLIKPNNDPIQATAHVDAARKYASIFMNADVKGYSQWFSGKSNNVAETLSRDWHHSNKELTFFLRRHFPEHMPASYHLSPLPSKIDSWMISLLWQLLVSEQLQEHHTTTGLELGSIGDSIASPSDATTLTLTSSASLNKISCSGLLPWLSEKADSRAIALNHLLKVQSEVPSLMWHRPFGNQANRIPLKTQTTCLASFYHDSSVPIVTKIPSRSNKTPSLSQS